MLAVVVSARPFPSEAELGVTAAALSDLNCSVDLSGIEAHPLPEQ